MSRKTLVIERIFFARWDDGTGALSSSMVSLKDVVAAINDVNTEAGKTLLSPRNSANFFKDFIRNVARANANWPQAVLDEGYTARQVTGGGQCFEFLLLPAGQTVPFVGIPGPDNTTPRHRLETASLPLASRRLGRREETWLTQVIVRVRLVETYFSLFSRLHVVQVDHLQMGAKLGRAEIDALYLAIVDTPSPQPQEEVIISCEAKGVHDDILVDQIIAQVRSLFAQSAVTQNRVVPIAVKVIGDSEIHLVEFEEITRASVAALNALQIRNDAVFTLVPPVPGIT